MPNEQPLTTASLRSGIADDLAALRAGKIRGAEARTRAYLAKQIIDTLKIEAVAMHLRVDSFVPVPLLEAA